MVNQLVCITLDEILASPRLKVTKIAPLFYCYALFLVSGL